MKRLSGVFLVLMLAACPQGSGSRPPSASWKTGDAANALSLLSESQFLEAEKAAHAALARDPTNPYAHTVAAITLYKRTVNDVTLDAASVIGGAVLMGGINHRYVAWALESASQRLDRVAEHLERASADPDLSLELCLACWKVDWNGNGTIDESDRLVLQVEYDENGDSIDEDDPRRKPTFHFDIGDIFWARAMIDFQRAALHIVSAYDYQNLDAMFGRWGRGTGVNGVTIPLKDAAEVARAKELILSALTYADRAREEYLAETDDIGEWLPNPSQKNHPLPLPVDQVLYDTWESVIRDLRNLVLGKEGLSVAALAQLGDHTWDDPPSGYVNIGRLLDNPGAIVIDRQHLEAIDHYKDRTKENVEATLRDFLGDNYVPEMKPSPLVGTVSRVKSEVERGAESLERKLKYLLWLN